MSISSSRPDTTRHGYLHDRILYPAVVTATLMINLACQSVPTNLAGTFDLNYRDLNYILTHYVSEERVDYEGIRGDLEPLHNSIRQMSGLSRDKFEGLSRPAQLAFLINAHNAYALDMVVACWPVQRESTIRRIRNRRNIMLIGQHWSLKSLSEHLMNYPYRTCRAFVLLNWGTKGCPELPPYALTGANLEPMLATRMRYFFSDPGQVRYDDREHVLSISSMFREYRKPIERNHTTLRLFLEQYLPEKTRSAIRSRRPRIRYFPFDASPITDVLHEKSRQEPMGNGD